MQIDEAFVSAPETMNQYTIIFVNLFDETIEYFWVNNSGIPELEGRIKAGERIIMGSCPHQCWLIRDSKHNLIAAFKSLDSLSLIILSEETDWRTK